MTSVPLRARWTCWTTSAGCSLRSYWPYITLGTRWARRTCRTRWSDRSGVTFRANAPWITFGSCGPDRPSVAFRSGRARIALGAGRSHETAIAFGSYRTSNASWSGRAGGSRAPFCASGADIALESWFAFGSRHRLNVSYRSLQLSLRDATQYADDAATANGIHHQKHNQQYRCPNRSGERFVRPPVSTHDVSPLSKGGPCHDLDCRRKNCFNRPGHHPWRYGWGLPLGAATTTLNPCE